MAAKKKTSKKKTAAKKSAAKKQAPPVAPAETPPSPWRADGSHVDSAPMHKRTVWVRITSLEPVKIRRGRAVVGHETKVTPDEAKRLVKQGIAKILPGI